MKWRPYPKYKDSGVEWLGAVPEVWDVKPLGSVARVKARLGWRGLTADEYVDDGYPMLATPNIKDIGIDFENVVYVSEQRYLESPEIMLQDGDVLLAKDGSTLGTVNVVRYLPRPSTLNGSIALIRPSAKLNPVYTYYWFRGDYVSNLIQSLKGGMGVPHLFQSDLRKFRMLIPPPGEQGVIAISLDRETAKIDTMIAKQQRLIELLQEKRQALISHAVTKGLNPDAPMKHSGVEWLSEVPLHWRVGAVKRFARLESGHTPSRLHSEYWENCTIPWFTLADVWQLRDDRVETVEETKELVSEFGLANSSARLLPAGTVMLSRTASVGFSGIMGVPMATTQDFANWVCKDDVLPEYLLYGLRAMRSDFDKFMYGSTHNTIYMPDIQKLQICLPPKAEQVEIVRSIRSQIAKIDRLAEKAHFSIDLMREYRTGLISAAVTGKIDVREANRA